MSHAGVRRRSVFQKRRPMVRVIVDILGRITVIHAEHLLNGFIGDVNAVGDRLPIILTGSAASARRGGGRCCAATASDWSAAQSKAGVPSLLVSG